MPSPIGHALAGVAVAWAIAPANPPDPAGSHAACSPPESFFRADASARRWRRITWIAAALAALPDADLLTPLMHRTATHSVGAVLIVFIVSALVTGRVTRRERARLILICTAAYASHLLLDWMAIDDSPPRGIQALWPFSHAWYISGWNVFVQTARHHLLTAETIAINIRAAVREIAILAPIVAAVVLLRRWRSRHSAVVSRQISRSNRDWQRDS